MPDPVDGGVVPEEEPVLSGALGDELDGADEEELPPELESGVEAAGLDPAGAGAEPAVDGEAVETEAGLEESLPLLDPEPGVVDVELDPAGAGADPPVEGDSVVGVEEAAAEAELEDDGESALPATAGVGLADA